jgi:2-polyprenyl-3-methyl-5-hydroxy-6-metoxy-1,4-benzoquinol methylase
VSKIVDPNLYDKNYYLTSNHGFQEFIDGLETTAVNPKFQDVLACCSFGEGKNVLDIGCGRGEIVYYAAKAGCNALGIDYSLAAIELANAFRLGLDPQIQARMKFSNIDALVLSPTEKYDYVFMIEVWEHMYDHQLDPLLQKVTSLMKPDGLLIITTPNGFYERYLYPAKRIVNIPANFVKLPLRVLRGKWRPKSVGDFFCHLFKVKPFSDEFMDKTHVNISSPPKIASMLKKNGLEVTIKCSDSSKNILSIIFSRWAGREMLVVAQKRNTKSA